MKPYDALILSGILSFVFYMLWRVNAAYDYCIKLLKESRHDIDQMIYYKDPRISQGYIQRRLSGLPTVSQIMWQFWIWPLSKFKPKDVDEFDQEFTQESKEMTLKLLDFCRDEHIRLNHRYERLPVDTLTVMLMATFELVSTYRDMSNMVHHVDYEKFDEMLQKYLKENENVILKRMKEKGWANEVI